MRMRNEFEDEALVWVFKINRISGLATFHRERVGIESEFTLILVLAVATNAVFLKDRLDVLYEVRRSCADRTCQQASGNQGIKR